MSKTYTAGYTDSLSYLLADSKLQDLCAFSNIDVEYLFYLARAALEIQNTVFHCNTLYTWVNWRCSQLLC